MIREVDLMTINPFGRKIEYVTSDKVLGYLEYSLIYDRIEIDNIFVEEIERSKGIGTKLMAYLVQEAINLRVINITLEVRVSNEIARKMGYNTIEQMDKVVLQKDSKYQRFALRKQIPEIKQHPEMYYF